MRMKIKIGFSGNNKILGTAADASVSDLVIIGGFDLAWKQKGRERPKPLFFLNLNT